MGGGGGAALRAWIGRFGLTWWAMAGLATLGLVAPAVSAHGRVLGRHSEARVTHRPTRSAPLVRLPPRRTPDPLAVGVLPFVALVLLLSFARRLPRPTALFVAIANSVGVWTLALAAVYATQPIPHPRIYERYVFYLEPLLVLALFVWLREGLPRPRGTRPLVLAAAALPLVIPFGQVLVSREWRASLSTVGLVPWGLIRLGFDSVAAPYAGAALLGLGFGALALKATPRTARRLPVVVLGYLLAVGLIVHAANVAVADRSERLGVTRSEPGWIDQLVGDRTNVAALWSGTPTSGWRSGYGIWENAFVNRSLTTVYTLRGDFPGKWTSTRLELHGTRRRRTTGRFPRDTSWPTRR